MSDLHHLGLGHVFRRLVIIAPFLSIRSRADKITKA
jgi:hypothetical protein